MVSSLQRSRFGLTYEELGGCLHEANDVLVGEHGSFGQTGRAARVTDFEDIIRLRWLEDGQGVTFVDIHINAYMMFHGF